jgi:hypothetical protein
VKQGRPGLLLVSEPGFSQGVLIMGFAGATGWLLAYDASNLQLVASFYASDGITRSGHGFGGIWGAGGAITADSAGNIYVVTGDGYFDSLINWGDSLIKLVLTLNPATGTYSLVPADYFTPSDEACRFTNGLDLGSAGPLILPSQGGATPDLIVQGGKAVTICDPTPSIYIVNRDNMGHVGGQVSLSQTASAGTESSPAYWASATANYIYNGADNDPIRAYTVSSAGVSTASVLQTGNSF